MDLKTQAKAPSSLIEGSIWGTSKGESWTPSPVKSFAPPAAGTWSLDSGCGCVGSTWPPPPCLCQTQTWNLLSRETVWSPCSWWWSRCERPQTDYPPPTWIKQLERENKSSTCEGGSSHPRARHGSPIFHRIMKEGSKGCQIWRPSLFSSSPAWQSQSLYLVENRVWAIPTWLEASPPKFNAAAWLSTWNQHFRGDQDEEAKTRK